MIKNLEMIVARPLQVEPKERTIFQWWDEF
jgi:hypothetical protein